MSGPAVNVPDGLQVYLDREQGMRQIRSAKTGELLREITDAELVAANRNYLQQAIDAEAAKMCQVAILSGGMRGERKPAAETFAALLVSAIVFGGLVMMTQLLSGWTWTDCVAWMAAAWVVLLNASLAVTKKRHGL